MSASALKSRKANNRKNQKKAARSKLRKTKLGFIPALSLVIIIALLSIHLWNNLSAINNKDGQIAELTQEFNSRRIKNDALQQKVDAPVDEEYIIDVARDNGYRKSDEIIFHITGE